MAICLNETDTGWTTPKVDDIVDVSFSGILIIGVFVFKIVFCVKNKEPTKSVSMSQAMLLYFIAGLRLASMSFTFIDDLSDIMKIRSVIYFLSFLLAAENLVLSKSNRSVTFSLRGNWFLQIIWMLVLLQELLRYLLVSNDGESGGDLKKEPILQKIIIGFSCTLLMECLCQRLRNVVQQRKQIQVLCTDHSDSTIKLVECLHSELENNNILLRRTETLCYSELWTLVICNISVGRLDDNLNNILAAIDEKYRKLFFVIFRRKHQSNPPLGNFINRIGDYGYVTYDKEDERYTLLNMNEHKEVIEKIKEKSYY